MSVSKDPEPRRIDPQTQGEDPAEPLPAPLPPSEIDPDDSPNAVPDPYHDTRAVHGDTGDPQSQPDAGIDDEPGRHSLPPEEEEEDG